MCDYSLEGYGPRRFAAGETLVLHQFTSGTKGFVSPGVKDCAVCIEPGTKLRVMNAHADLRATLGIPSATVDVVFAQNGETGTWFHRDGLKLPDGRFVSLQALPVGLTAICEPILAYTEGPGHDATRSGELVPVR